jgi:membrane protein DedA with SNARE-associated domain
MLAALGFYLGLIAHIVVILFFAGYAAGDGEIDWWYVTAWGS